MEFLAAAGRIYSQANIGDIPFDTNVITAAQVNATIGVGEAILAMLQELRSRSKEERKGSRSKEGKKGPAFNQDQDPRGSEGKTNLRPLTVAFGYRTASLIAGRRSACAQVVPCWSGGIRTRAWRALAVGH
jgi:hypothetical protein